MGNVVVNCRCPLCGRISFVSCDEAQWNVYEAGALIQDAFPTMDVHTRETIISGMCVSCQESFFVEDDDECDGDCEECEAWAECPDRHES